MFFGSGIMEFSPTIHHNRKEECLMRTIIAQETAINKFISENCEKSFNFLTTETILILPLIG